jgi:hypothetical protein
MDRKWEPYQAVALECAARSAMRDMSTLQPSQVGSRMEQGVFGKLRVTFPNAEALKPTKDGLGADVFRNRLFAEITAERYASVGHATWKHMLGTSGEPSVRAVTLVPLAGDEMMVRLREGTLHERGTEYSTHPQFSSQMGALPFSESFDAYNDAYSALHAVSMLIAERERARNTLEAWFLSATRNLGLRRS